MTFISKYDKAKVQSKSKINKAMWKAAENLLGEANKSVPNDEGILEGSGTVTQEDLPSPQTVYSTAKAGKENAVHPYKVDPFGESTFFISYNTPYAIKLHESSPGEYNFRGKGQAKWLEKTSKRISGRLEKWVAKEVR